MKYLIFLLLFIKTVYCDSSLSICLLNENNELTEGCEAFSKEQKSSLVYNISNGRHKREVRAQNETIVTNTSTPAPQSTTSKVQSVPTTAIPPISNSPSTTPNTTTTQTTTTTTTQTTTTTTQTTTTTTTTTESPIEPDFGNDSVSITDKNLDTSKITFDHHRYYKSFLKQGGEVVEYWVNFEMLAQNGTTVHTMLSDSYRRALTVELSFDFPFYGHILQNVTIATGGFLFTGSFLHKWLAATQYIAPLMANFDTSVSESAYVKYFDNGTSLTVQWENVLLQDNPAAGPFTFQVSIHSNGNIIFAYKDIPITLSLIKNEKHPVKVGLSDAYIMEKTIFYIRKKTIYEYHKIDMKKNGYKVANNTAIFFKMLPNCVQFSSCKDCLSVQTNFKCEWCQRVGRCSDGMDRHRQSWIEEGCLESSRREIGECANLPPVPSTVRPIRHYDAAATRVVESQDGGSYFGLTVGIIFILLILGALCWLYYAYYHPHTSSGQFLIKYRPSNWNFGRPKYTAATMHSIHM